ncbi:MAG: FeoA family protein [Acidobacteriota bacterium]
MTSSSSPSHDRPVTDTPAAEELPLTDLPAGCCGILRASDLDGGDRQLLCALGLSEQCHFRLCKAGDPFIVQVRGTRIGLSPRVASRLIVLPDPG